MTLPPQVRWGWSIQCAEPGCEETLSGWSGETIPGYHPGCPPLPTWQRNDTTREGWYWRSWPHKEQPKPYYGVFRAYRAYCPDHAGPAFEWRDAVQEWQDARQKHGRKVHDSLLGRLGDACARVFNIGPQMADWEKDNPKPKPPWGGE